MHGIETIRRMNASLPAGAFVGSSERVKVLGRLRWKPTKGLYANSTYTCTYNPESSAGFSYRWWQVCGVFSGLPVFNTYHYSATTAQHQGRLAQVFAHDHGPDYIRVEFGPGLQKAGYNGRPPLLDIRDFLVGERTDLAEKQESGREGSRAYAWRAERIAKIDRDLARIDAVLLTQLPKPEGF